MVTKEGKHLRVLVADERGERVEEVAEVVRELGHEVVALEIDVSRVGPSTRRERPDVALVGFADDSDHALELISKIVEESTCPVIALLEKHGSGFISDAADRGIFAHASPTHPGELQGAIHTALLRYSEHASLEAAFGRRAVVERAKGILMERHALEEREAFELLRGHARSTNKKLADLAQAVLDGHKLLPPKS